MALGYCTANERRRRRRRRRRRGVWSASATALYMYNYCCLRMNRRKNIYTTSEPSNNSVGCKRFHIKISRFFFLSFPPPSVIIYRSVYRCGVQASYNIVVPAPFSNAYAIIPMRRRSLWLWANETTTTTAMMPLWDRTANWPRRRRRQRSKRGWIRWRISKISRLRSHSRLRRITIIIIYRQSL